ncbi:MAG: phosphohistidine phosphatase SixA [Fretibacterium sp.]|nr:phosphohistidine phosphatase SixA [Fretibacterium sp.]
MKLWLMRHGDAVHQADDDLRPLSGTGREEARRAGQFLEQMKESPALILHSTLRRSAETAALVARELGLEECLTEHPGLRPEDDPENLVFELDEEDEDLLLVGHQPFLSILASLLLTRDAGQLPLRWTTGSLLCAERDSGSWKLLSFTSAKELRADSGDW